MKFRLWLLFISVFTELTYSASLSSHELIIKFKKSMQLSLQAESALANIALKDVYTSSGRMILINDENQKLLSKLSITNLDIAYSEPNIEYKLQGTISSVSEQPRLSVPYDWGLYSIGAFQAWPLVGTYKKIKVAILDTGMDYTHPDLKDSVMINEQERRGLPGVDDDYNGLVDDIVGYDFSSDDNDPMDDNGHGTHCAGILGAKHDSYGVTGVMPTVEILPIKFLDKHGQGDLFDALRSIEYAIDQNVDIISSSWGDYAYSELLKEVIEKAGGKGILFVAAAGNGGSNNDLYPLYPASYKAENIFSVAAHDTSGALAAFSSYGKESIDILAPGVNILSTFPNKQFRYMSGTSMATPFVAGAIGLYLANNGERNYKLIRSKLYRGVQNNQRSSSVVRSGGTLHLMNFLAL